MANSDLGPSGSPFGYWTHRDPPPAAGPVTDRMRRAYVWAFWAGGVGGSFVMRALPPLEGRAAGWLFLAWLGLVAWVMWAQWRLMMLVGNNRRSALLYALAVCVPIVSWFVLSSIGGACDRNWGKIGEWTKRTPATPDGA
jgi:hypothetical protein